MTVFDKRGTGLSDRSLGFGSLEERANDIGAVMDAAGIKRAVIYAASESAPMACLFAAQHPDRVAGLVLYPQNPLLMLTVTSSTIGFRDEAREVLAARLAWDFGSFGW